MFSTRRSSGSSLLRAIGLALALTCLPGACGGGGDGGGSSPDPEFVPDATFGEGGLVTGRGSEPNTSYDYVDVGDDGALAILGKTQYGVSTFGTLLIEKRLADGSLDAAFGGDGQVEASFSAGYTPKGVVLNDQDGSVLAVADRALEGYSLLKRAANGSPVSSFGIGGGLHVTTTAPFKVGGMVVDADGKIVVAGSTDGGGYVMRHLASGAPDPAWNGGAPYTFQVLGANTRVVGLVPRTGGGYLLTGTRASTTGPDWIIVGRFSTSGQPIPAYGSDGFCMYEPSVTVELVGLVARPDGACAAYGETDTKIAFALGVNPDGDVVGVFGYLELATLFISDALRGAHAWSGDVILFAVVAQASRDVTLWQVHENGYPDEAFGDAGVFTIPIDEDTSILQLARHPDGGILLIGRRRPESDYEGVVMRFVPATP